MENKIIYEGKAKYIMESNNSDEIIVYFKDSTTAFNGIKRADIKTKGILNNKISAIIFKYLKKNNIKTHFIKMIDDRQQLCKKVDIIPLEFICRNVAAGNMAKRLGLKSGTIIKDPVLEICYKNDELNDPLINDNHAMLLKAATKKELEYCYEQVILINSLLIDLFKSIDIKLVDFKIEFGIDQNGDIILADEFSPDNCRLWDLHTQVILDKDVFRKDLGNIVETYQIVLDKLEYLNI